MDDDQRIPFQKECREIQPCVITSSVTNGNTDSDIDHGCKFGFNYCDLRWVRHSSIIDVRSLGNTDCDTEDYLVVAYLGDTISE